MKNESSVWSDRCLPRVVVVNFFDCFCLHASFHLWNYLVFIHTYFDRFISRLGVHCRRARRKNDWTPNWFINYVSAWRSRSRCLNWAAFFSSLVWLKPFHSIKICLDTIHMAIIHTQSEQCWIKLVATIFFMITYWK